MNRLADQASPYLRQHADNPVDWYPWGAEALERAVREDRPILLSIGYAACHWCHVMAHESFADGETARLMNEHFVNIKVDREERPDIDGIYMGALQAMTGHGGWPMTVFLTPDGAPFYAGTYYPPDDRLGMPSFRRVLRSVANSYANRRADVQRTADSVKEMFDRAGAALDGGGPLDAGLLEQARRSIAERYDAVHGGFNGAPKFPQAMSLAFLLRCFGRSGSTEMLAMVRESFVAMSRGGIYDQIAGGFHRYSVDAQWMVPHFEKMLYDNALLVSLGTHLWQATGDAETWRTIEESIDWVAREMTSPAGGFYSSLDADSEGEEGRFYVWTLEELEAVLGDDAAVAAAHFGATAEGNFEGRNILHVAVPLEQLSARTGRALDELRRTVDDARRRLLEQREGRVRPGRDEKVLASWNGLMLRGIALAAKAFDRDDYRELALRNGAFLFREMVRGDRVMRVHMEGVTREMGFLEDQASVALAAISLYELTFDRTWLDRAAALARAAVHWFWDEGSDSFYDTAHDHERLITRPREVTDNATPSGTSLVVELLAVLGELLDDEPMRSRARRVLDSLAQPMARYGAAFGHLLGAADLVVHGSIQVALVAAAAPVETAVRLFDAAIASRYVPALILAAGVADDPNPIALLANRPARNGLPTAYVCRHYSCRAPVTDALALSDQLDQIR